MDTETSKTEMELLDFTVAMLNGYIGQNSGTIEDDIKIRQLSALVSVRCSVITAKALDSIAQSLAALRYAHAKSDSE